MQRRKRALNWWPALSARLAAAVAGVGKVLKWRPSAFARRGPAMITVKRPRGILRWWPALLIVLVIAGVGVGALIRKRASQSSGLSQVYTVARGNLTSTVSCTGEVYAPRTSELVFDVTRIPLVEMSTAPGRQVKAGDVLARIDRTALARAVTQAEADLTVAQDNLEKAQNPYSELDLMQAKLAVGQAELGLADAKKTLDTAQTPYSGLDVIQAKLVVTQAQTALADAQANLETVVKPDVAAAQSAARDAAAALKTAQNQQTVAQSDPSNVAQLRTLEYEATWYRNNYWAAQVKFEKGEIDKLKLDFEYSNMLAAQEKLKVAQLRADTALTSAQDQVAKTQEAYRVAAENLAKLEQGADPLALTKAQYQVAQADYNLAKARTELTKIEAGPDSLEVTRARSQVAQAEYTLAKAQADLAKVQAGPLPKDVEVAKAKVVSAQATLEAAQAALQAATMTAPFAGTVVSVGVAVGDLVSSGVIVITLADLTNLRVRAIVDETDISQMAIGQEVGITFDAFPGERLQGRILEVPLQGTLTQNILTYEVPVSLIGAAEVALKPGMTANLSVVAGRRQNVLLVPALAVLQSNQGNVVRVQGSPRNPPVETAVVLGLGDGMNVEVKQGLKEGDHVVVDYQATQQTAARPGNAGPLIPAGGPGGRR